jgi:hypothetical protein
MENEKVSFFLLRNGKFFNKKDIKEVESIVSKVDTDSIANLSVLRFRNPLFMSLLSFVLGIFGVDRFLLGDIKRGILKALTLPIQMIASIFLFKGIGIQQNNVFFGEDVLLGAGQTNSFYLTASTVLFSISALLFIYYIVDIFLIYRDTYKYNYRILVDFAGEGTKRKIITHKESEGVAEEAFNSDVTTPSSKRNLSKSRTTNRRRKTSEDSVVDLENKSKKSRKKR